MAEFMRLESSRFYGSNNSGCIWDLFHIFDSYQKGEKKKRMLSYRRMGGDNYGVGTNTLMEKETGGENTVTNKGANNIDDNKANNMNKSSGKTRILNFIRKKLLKRQKHKGKTSHSSSHQMHTTSIHHSETSAYESCSELNETSTTALNLDETDSLPMSEHESLVINGLYGTTTDSDIDCISNKIDELGNHLLDEHKILKEKLFEARDALLKKKDSDPNGMAVEFSLLSKIFLETLHLFNTNREALYNVCKGQNSFVANDIQLLRCPAKDRVLNRSVSLTGLEFSGNAVGVVPDIEVLPGGSHEMKKQGETKTVLSRLKELKQMLKDVIVESKKEHQRISMDRILDKVPSGHKLLQDEIGPISRDGRGFKINRVGLGSSIGKFGYQRSRSLTESLDRYSQLMDSISANEVRKAPERSNSNRDRKQPKTHRRMPSNPEFLSSHSFIKDVQSEMFVAFQSPMKPTLEHDSDLASTAGDSDKLNKDLVMQPVVEEIAYEQEESLESNIVANVPDECIIPTVETSITETKGHERNECLQIVPFQFSKTLEEISDLFNEQEPQIEDEPNAKSEKTSPISVLDPDTSLSKFTVMAGSDPQQLQQNLEEKVLSKPNFNEETSSTTGDQANSFLTHVNENDTARFNYVKHILSKTGYEALLFEPDNSSIESEPTNYTLSGMPFEEQLIYDLINEVLFQIYEYYTAPSSWLSRFHPKITSMPTGSCLLEEVWAEIRWHLSSPQGIDAMTDKILARDFTKCDDWMNLYRDAECFGLLLEQLILDDLVDEVILDIDEL